MTAWPFVPLADVCSLRSGGTPDRTVARFFEGTIPWITSADITSTTVTSARSHITQEAIDGSATTYVPAGTVLLVTRTGVGKVTVAGVDLCFSQDVTALTPNPKRLDATYLVEFLRTQETYFAGLARGATIKGIPRDVVAGLKIPLPALRDQRRVAHLLQSADRLREQRRKSLAALDALRESIFDNLFSESIGSNGSSYPTVMISDVTSVVTKGTTPTNVGLAMNDSGVPFVRVQNLKEGRVDTAIEPLYISQDTHQRLARSIIYPGDVLVSIAGTIGRAALVDMGQPEMNCNQAVAILRPTKRVSGTFLLGWLQHPVAQRQMRGAQVTGTISNLSLTQLRNLKLRLPPASLQTAFAKQSAALDVARSAQRASAVALDALFASLQQRAFRGDL